VHRERVHDRQPVGADQAQQISGVPVVRGQRDGAEAAQLVEEQRVVQGADGLVVQRRPGPELGPPGQ
jgi:hypothetical protein